MSMGRGQARAMVGQRVLVTSGRGQGVAGQIRHYREKSHRFLVRLDEARPDQLGRPSEWFDCPVGSVRRGEGEAAGKEKAGTTTK